jgi:hypothetical protein
MRQEMIAASSALRELLDANEATVGLYIHIHGKNLVLGREDSGAEAGEAGSDDRVRLTRLTKSRYGLSVKRHTGRWEQTPFSGTLAEMVNALTTYMQHLVGPY